jgi:DsbC/DsbD-like thiol-disulfide interchange protein
MVLCAAGTAAPAQLSSRAVVPGHLSVGLVSEASAVAPGHKFWIGLDFALDPGWHIYWINAGDSGQAPRATWTAPAGYKIGPLEWPLPARIVDSETIVDYGYKNHVLLMAPVGPSSSVRAGTSAEIAADVSWLVCRDICVPGKARVSLPIRVAPLATIDAGQHALFEATRREIPKPLPAGWSVSVKSTGDSFVITIETGHSEKAATFFPLEDLQVENAAPQRAQAFARGVRLTVKRAEELRKTPQALNGVLAFPSGSAYVVKIPVT